MGAGERAGGSGSDRDELAMHAPSCAEAVRDLTDRRVGPDGLDDRRQEVVHASSGIVEAGQRRRPGRRIPFGPDATNTLDLAPLPFRVDPLERRRHHRLVPEPVDPDDDLVARVDGPLDAVGRLLDRPLLQPELEGPQRPAGGVDLGEVICWVRRASRTLSSVGNASASSREFVCRLCAPPRTAARAWSVVRTTLLSTDWAVSDEPAVCT